MQNIIGICVFVCQPMSGYCYNSDSIFLYDFICQFKPKGSLLDVGCGVGILSLLLGRDFELDITIIDKQEIMLRYATHNFALNRLEAKSHLGDFAEFFTKDRYDYIISNPPFYNISSKQSKNIHLNIARYAKHLPIEEFFRKVKSYLKPKGRFIFCYDAKQIDSILYNLKKNEINPEKIQFVHSKIDRESKLVMIAARNNSKSMTKILSPLIVFDKTDTYTVKAKKVFKRANTYSIKGEFGFPKKQNHILSLDKQLEKQ